MKKLRVSVLLLVSLLMAGALSTGCAGSGARKSMEVSINTGDMLQKLLDRTRSVVGKVDSGESARRAKAELQQIMVDYDDLLNQVPKLSPEGRANLARQSTRALPEMRQLANRIHERSNLDEILGVTLDQIVAKLGQVR